MKRTAITEQFEAVLVSARRLAQRIEAEAIVLLADLPYDFTAVKRAAGKSLLLVASDKPDVQRCAVEDEIALVPLINEPETVQMQLSQALLEAIADDLLRPGVKVVALYPGFEVNAIDTISVVNLTEHLVRLTARDLQRLETQVPLETLRMVVDLACEIGREGREGKPVGTTFVVGDHRKVLRLSHPTIHNPFRGYAKKERQFRDARTRESIKEFAQIDCAFVISADGYVESAGRYLDAPAHGLTLSKGLGSRHWAAAAISKATKGIAITVSESTGTVRLFQDGIVMLRIEPLDRAMKWQAFEFEPPPTTD